MKKRLICLGFLAVLMLLSSPAFAAEGETATAEPMTVAAAIALAIIVVQFVKEKLIPKIWDKLGTAGKFITTALASAGVTLYKYLIKETLALDLGTALFAAQVFIGAWFGYEVLKAVAPALSRTVTNKTS